MKKKKRSGVKDATKFKEKGIKFNTEKGQHILKNPGVVHAIVEKSAVKGTDTVLEVGSGTGNLSMKLLERAGRLIAYELDNKMVAELKKRVLGTPVQYKLHIITGDVIKAPEWPAFDVCVSNLPYQISSPFIFRLLLQRPLPRYAVLMLQKEFADRLLAKPGSKVYCRLSVCVQLLARVEHLMRVKRSEFVPPPKVDSAVEWDGMLRIAFLRKNKTLLALFKQKQVVNVLSKNYAVVCAARGQKVPEDFCMAAHIESVLEGEQFSKRRARSMAIEDFLALMLAFNRTDVHFC
uniref:rRNA adenine N(6)-methyltransferase n=1 Tax=Globodera pallida TaxID=36090 RepID=A0A183C1Z4_GLOPA